MGVVGGFVLGFTRELARIYVTASMASWIIEKKYRNSLTKEGPMRGVFDAQSLDLSHLNPVKVSYEPKAIRSEAIQVTPENIGKLSLEFEEELYHDGSSGLPYFAISVKRFDLREPDGQKAPRHLYVRVTDWIVSLWDEIHVFRNNVMLNTFTFDDYGPLDGDDGSADYSDTRGQHSKKLVSLARPYAPEPLGLNTPMNVQPVDWETGIVKTFRPSQRVRVTGTDDVGMVTVVDVERPDGSVGVEVLLDRSDRPFIFDPNNLEHMDFQPNSGVVEGPEGTQLMPRVDE